MISWTIIHKDGEIEEDVNYRIRVARVDEVEKRIRSII